MIATILVIDDEPTNVLLLERILQRSGQLHVVPETQSANAVATFCAVRPDLVMLDLHMPAPDGFTLLRELREHISDEEYLPIMVLTADATRETRERALSLGASDFLTKPIDATEVLLRTANLLATRALQARVASENGRLETQVLERTYALAQALEQAQSADRAKDQFLANVGHELRTPLTAMRGALGLLSGPLLADVPSRSRKLIASAFRNTMRLDGLVTDILLLQDLHSGRIAAADEDVHIGDVLTELVREFGADESAAARIRAAIPGDMDVVQADAVLLEDVLRRIIDNALRHTAGSEVTITVELHDEGGPPCAVVIRDNGPGIAARQMDAVQQAFEQTDNSDTRKQGGLGVGLTIARGLCDLMGFMITLQNGPDGGARVRVCLSDAAAPSNRRTICAVHTHARDHAGTP